MGSFDYDFLVIGCGPAGQKAALQAAKLRKQVAIVDEREVVGGICVNVGTIPSKSFREAVAFFSGFKQRSVYGPHYRIKTKIEMEDLLFRCAKIIGSEIEVIRHQLIRNNVEIIVGKASFVDQHTILVQTPYNEEKKLSAEFIVVAVGAKPYQPPHIKFDQKVIFDSDNILTMKQLPRTMAIVGGGVIGVEYGTMFANLGVSVTVVDGRKRILPFVDEEIIETLKYQMRAQGITLRLGEEVKDVSSKDDSAVLRLASGKVLVADVVLFSAGRVSATEGLNLEAIGVALGEKGKILVDENYKTSVPNIYAAGDVIGFPALASTSAHQGRMAVLNALNFPYKPNSYPMPYGIYSIPEISMVGLTEDEATSQNIPYEVGISKYRDIARGAIIGDMEGMLKILFHRETKKILGVHAIGENSSEIIHLGQAVMALNGDLNFLLDAVFNYPTLTEGYKIAAYNAFNKLAAAGI